MIRPCSTEACTPGSEAVGVDQSQASSGSSLSFIKVGLLPFTPPITIDTLPCLLDALCGCAIGFVLVYNTSKRRGCFFGLNSATQISSCLGLSTASLRPPAKIAAVASLDEARSTRWRNDRIRIRTTASRCFTGQSCFALLDQPLHSNQLRSVRASLSSNYRRRVRTESLPNCSASFRQLITTNGVSSARQSIGSLARSARRSSLEHSDPQGPAERLADTCETEPGLLLLVKLAAGRFEPASAAVVRALPVSFRCTALSLEIQNNIPRGSAVFTCASCSLKNGTPTKQCLSGTFPLELQGAPTRRRETSRLYNPLQVRKRTSSGGLHTNSHTDFSSRLPSRRILTLEDDAHQSYTCIP